MANSKPQDATAAMQLSRDDVVQLARQAVLELSDADIDDYTEQLRVIVETVSKVSELADQDIAATSHVTDAVNGFRVDEVRSSLSAEEALAMAPAAEANRFRVPQILGEEQ